MQLPTEVTPESLLVEVYPGISQGMKLAFLRLIELLVTDGWCKADVIDTLSACFDPTTKFFFDLCSLVDDSDGRF